MKTRIAVLLSIAASTAAAHHGFGTFDMDAEVRITGTVTDLAFVNPHSWLYLDVADSDGQVVPYRCEMRSATTLRRSGWSPDMFPVGERITIEGSPDRNEPHACYVSTVTFDDGSSIDRYGQRTPPTAMPSARPARLPGGEPNLNGEWAGEQLVMADPRGVTGSLVPLSEAGDAPTDGPLFSPEAARRLFVARIELTEAGRAAQTEMQQQTNPGMRCEPISVMVDWTYDSPVNRITQSDDRIVVDYGKFNYSRTIWMNLTEHPAAIEPSLTGHSIGRWDGDVLVVDTVGFAPGALTRTLPHSEQLHFVERFSLDPATMALTREFEANDPAYFVEAYVGDDVVYPSNVPFSPPVCDDRSLFE
jgi:hypothetical protein